MFTAFLYLLRARGVDVSLTEWMTLMEGLDKGLSHSSFTEFYRLCRTVLVKSEADFDKFDEAFLEYFRDMKDSGALSEELLKWLSDPSGKPGRDFDMERAMRNAGLTEEEIREMFRQRLEEQKEEHNGGSYWIGTGGVSVFGNRGFSPKGIRVGGEGGLHRAFSVAGERSFRDFRGDSTLDIRQFQMAFRKLRQYSSRAADAEPEFDVEGTIRATCDNGGMLKVVYEKPRKNTVKVLLLMDSGGSMDYYRKLCASLFQAVNCSNHFKDLKVYYFHNCIFSRVYTEPELFPSSAVPTEWLLKNLDGSYRVIIVGDAQMDPGELLARYTYGDENGMTGMDWLLRFRDRYPHLVWLNPSARPIWGKWWTRTYDLIDEQFAMYQLTLENLDAALKKLMSAR